MTPARINKGSHVASSLDTGTLARRFGYGKRNISSNIHLATPSTIPTPFQVHDEGRDTYFDSRTSFLIVSERSHWAAGSRKPEKTCSCVPPVKQQESALVADGEHSLAPPVWANIYVSQRRS